MDGELARELVDAFVRLAKGDFSVRLARNYTRDQNDVLAFFVNLMAEELARLQTERESRHRELQETVSKLNEAFVALASGDFTARAPRTGRGDPADVLALMFDEMAASVGDTFAQLSHQRRVLEAILESIIDGVLLLDERGVVLRSNKAIGQLLGVAPSELEGKPLGSILSPGEEQLAEGIAVVDRSPIRDRRTRFRAATGADVELSLSASPHRDESGRMVGIVLLVRDDRELRHIQAQLQISDRLATMGTVAAGVAHEINNPLAFLIGNLEFIDEELEELAGGGPLDPERTDELRRAIKASRGGADRVKNIVRDLRSFSRVEQTAPTRVDLQKAVDSALTLVRNEARHHARLVKEYGPTPLVLADEGRLVQVFLNLVQNAAHAIPMGDVDGNEIRLVTGTDESGAAFVEVRDTGMGIAPEHLRRIFDLFFTTKPVGTGTGLGLAICHKIVSSLGGRIDVRSEVGVGSTFRVVLPAARETPVPVPAVKEPVTPAPRLKVLVVDDEVEVGESIRRSLGSKHEVEFVTRAAEALERVGRRNYDVIISDLLMPEMTGMELADRLARDHPELARRVIFMTAGAFSVEAQSFLRRTLNPTVEKPYDAAVLEVLITNLATRAKR